MSAGSITIAEIRLNTSTSSSCFDTRMVKNPTISETPMASGMVRGGRLNAETMNQPHRIEST
ncbi:hypothetical protein D3C85_1923460 [compost metagenome]